MNAPDRTSSPPRALITGATGFVGPRLVADLRRDGVEVVVLTRDPARARRTLGEGVEAHRWDAMAGPPPAAALEGVDVVYHLLGENVAEGRWNDAKRARIRDSRVLGTRHLVEGIAAADPRPRALVSASAIGIYGDRADAELTEEAALGEGFLAEVCRDWELESRCAEGAGVRVVQLRIGIVLGRGGGAMAKMLLPFRLGLGGRLGSGRQWMPWVHVDDVVGLARFVAEQDVAGPVNAVSPSPCTNADFTRALGRALNRPAVFPVPGPALRLAVGEFAGVLLASTRCVPLRAQQAGYRFRFSALAPALADCVEADGREPNGGTVHGAGPAPAGAG